MSDSSVTLVPERIFIEPAERDEMEKRITSWLIEKGWIEPDISDCALCESGGRRITREGNTHISGCEPDHDLAVNGFCVEQFYDMTEQWFTDEGNPLISCPSCGKSSDIREYILDPPWGFCQIGFVFWNLWDITDEFIAEFTSVLGGPVRVIWAHL